MFICSHSSMFCWSIPLKIHSFAPQEFISLKDNVLKWTTNCRWWRCESALHYKRPIKVSHSSDQSTNSHLLLHTLGDGECRLLPLHQSHGGNAGQLAFNLMSVSVYLCVSVCMRERERDTKMRMSSLLKRIDGRDETWQDPNHKKWTWAM